MTRLRKIIILIISMSIIRAQTGSLVVETSEVAPQRPALRVISPPEEVAGVKGSESVGPVPEARVPEAPAPELLAELAAESERLETATPQEILRWAAERYDDRFTMATAFGAEGMVLIHMLAEVAPRTRIFNLDTGYQFPETLEMVDRIRSRYGLIVHLEQPEETVEEYERRHGGPLYKTNSDQCCADRKLSVLKRAIGGMRAWASAIRRDQSEHRARVPILGWDKKFGLVKVSPLANWTKRDVWGLITERDIPYNPLHDRGFASIGCWPCTRALLCGEDERAGRWSGTGKTECGLHTQD